MDICFCYQNELNTLNTIHSFILYSMAVPDDGRYKLPKHVVEDKWMRFDESLVVVVTLEIYINFSISDLDFHLFWAMLTVHQDPPVYRWAEIYCRI
jgi:hypothetical protein